MKHQALIPMSSKNRSDMDLDHLPEEISLSSFTDTDFDTTDDSDTEEICYTQSYNWPRPGDNLGLLTINEQSYSVDCHTKSSPPNPPPPKPTAHITTTTNNTTEKPKVKGKVVTTSGAHRKGPLSRKGKKGKLLKQEEIPRPKKPTQVCICLSGTRYDVIGRVAKRMGWRTVREHDMWNIFWTDSILGVEFCKDMRRFQKINHFPGMFEICRKDLLARNLNRMLRLFPLDYQIYPKTWCFPADLGEAQQYAKTHKNKTFILKPDQGAQGKGISITKTLKDIKPTDRMICQVYLSKPLLIDGFKFDLRVYTLITSTDPLRIFVYNEGLARFATSKYKEPGGHNTTNMFMHLTNYSVNKHSRTFSNDDEAGSKRKFSTLNRILSAEGYDVVTLWNNIDDIIVKTILSAWPMLKHNYNASFPTHDIMQACFEILGVDILIDQKLKPYILEVNHSPSFHTDEQVDREVKEALIYDTFNILNISHMDKKRVLDEDKRRVKDRLLKKINHTQPTDFTSKPALNEDGSYCQEKAITSPWAQQICWEETHLGGFRRIMPAPGDPNKYAPFFILQNQASVYCDTAASKRREMAAKQIRIELAERAKFNQAPIPFPRNMKCKVQGEDDDDKLLKKKRKAKPPGPINAAAGDGFAVINVIESDERERLSLMAQRDFLIRSCGLLPCIFTSFFRNELLTEADRRKYNDLYSKLVGSYSKTKATESCPSNRAILSNPKIHLASINPITETDSRLSHNNQIGSHFGVVCTEVQLNKRPEIPKTISNEFNYRSNKATVARRVTNVARRSVMALHEL